MRRQRIAVLALVALFAPSGASAELRLIYYGITEGRLAFTYQQGDERDIYVIDFGYAAARRELAVANETSRARETVRPPIFPLVQRAGREGSPSFSPDGTKLLYDSDESGDRELYVVSADGGSVQRLTDSPKADQDGDWLPAGDKIVFSSARAGGRNIFDMNADGSAPQALTTWSTQAIGLRVSPGGEEIAYLTDSSWPGWDVAILSLAGRRSRVITASRENCSGIAWNDDGSALFFSLGSEQETNIYRFERGETKLEEITTARGRELDAVISDDGARMFFVQESLPQKGDFQLFVMELKTKAARQLTSGEGAVRYLSYTSLPQYPPRAE